MKLDRLFRIGNQAYRAYRSYKSKGSHKGYGGHKSSYRQSTLERLVRRFLK